MSATANKRLMRAVMLEMSQGNIEPLIEAMSDDMRWTWMGSGRWSHTFEGKDAVVNELLAAVKATLAQSFEVVFHSLIAEADYVVIEHSGRSTTRDGRPYHNKYCWVCRFADGKMRELREYMDTELVTETFGAEE